MRRFRYIAAQDLATLVIGDIEESNGIWRFVEGPRSIAAAPEAYAQYCFVGTDGLAGFVVVTSPGSATALRVSVSLVNAFAFTKNVPVIGIECAIGASPNEITVALASAVPHRFAVPRYVNDPKITAPTHDALKRKLTS